MTSKNIIILTEEQGLLLSFLNKYRQNLYRFSDYNNYLKWVQDDKALDNATEAVISNSYVDDDSMEEYINDCILSVEEIENN